MSRSRQRVSPSLVPSSQLLCIALGRTATRTWSWTVAEILAAAAQYPIKAQAPRQHGFLHAPRRAVNTACRRRGHAARVGLREGTLSPLRAVRRTQEGRLLRGVHEEARVAASTGGGCAQRHLPVFCADAANALRQPSSAKTQRSVGREITYRRRCGSQYVRPNALELHVVAHAMGARFAVISAFAHRAAAQASFVAAHVVTRTRARAS